MQPVAIESDPHFLDRLAVNPKPDLDAVLEILSEHGHRVTVEWPQTTLAVCLMVTAMGFDCTPFTIAALLEREQFEQPRLFGAALAWRPHDVASLIAALHANRLWLPGRFTDQKTDRERTHEQRRAVAENN